MHRNIDPDRNLPGYLASFGFDVEHVLDVGVNYGTPWLYKAFPDTHFLLIDPMPGFEEKLTDRPGSYSVHEVGLGTENATRTFTIQGGRSSFLDVNEFDAPALLYPSDSPEANPVERTVSITTLDGLVEKQIGNAPFGMKVDTEGFERQVVSGGRKCLKNCRFIILELSVLQRFRDGDFMSEMFAELSGAGFEFYNFLNPWMERPKFYDFLFLPKRTDLVPIAFEDGGVHSLLLRSRLAAKDGDPDAAMSFVQKALAVKPDSIPAQCWHARLLYRSANYQKALEAALAVLERAPDHPSALSVASSSHKQLKNRDEALRFAHRAYSMHWDKPACVREYIYCLLQANRADEALELTRSYMADYPDDLAGYVLTARAARKSRRDEEADAAILEGLKKFPRNPKLLEMYTATG